MPDDALLAAAAGFGGRSDGSRARYGTIFVVKGSGVRSGAAALLLVIGVSACSVGSTAAPPRRPVAQPPTPVEATTDPAGVPVGGQGTRALIGLPRADEMSAAWRETLFLPYGETDDTLGLGTRIVRDGTVAVGPEFGAQAPDGSWWMLDTERARLARYRANGRYAGSVDVDEEHLVDGEKFPHQLPRVLADGTFMATAFTAGGTTLLTVRDGEVSSALISPQLLTPWVDDGATVYALDETGRPVAIDVAEGRASQVTWFRTRNGTRFMLTISGDELQLELPDATPAVERSWALLAATSGAAAVATLELATDVEGRFHLLLSGSPDQDPLTPLAAYVRLGADGRLELVEEIRNPFGEAEPGSPAHLGVAPGATEPWLMFIDGDGVRVFERQETAPAA